MEWKGQELLERVRDAAMRGIFRGTEAVRTRAVRKIMSGGRTGIPYRRRGVTHVASAPGEPPASDTGRLARSGTTSYDRARLSGKVTFSTEYAEPLELGTEIMEPRPFLRPSLAEEKDAIMEDVANEIRGVLQ